MVSYEEATVEELTTLLKSYVSPELWDDNDFETIIKRAKVISERYIVEFKLAGVTLYLDTRDLSYVDAHPFNHPGD